MSRVTGGGTLDLARRTQAKRSGREAGCWTYIPGELLLKAGYTKSDPPPFYRVWGGKRGRYVIVLYPEP